MNNNEVYVWLHNIRSVHNVGSIFRTADAVGIAGIILSGYTPTPIDRFGRKRRDVAKVALGAEDAVTWRQFDDWYEVVAEYRERGFQLLALEQDAASIDYKEYVVQKPAVLLVGNEPDGIELELLGQMDTIIEIPMSGDKESLNVSVATGIALYRLLDI